MLQQPISRLLDLSGQVAFITGANRGIGEATARIFAQAGAKVALVARNQERLAAVASEIASPDTGATLSEKSVLALAADVGNESQVNEAVTQTLDAWGRIDILVNNAGLVSPGPIDQITPADWNRIIQVNLTGTYLCSHAVIPSMKAQRHGRIINISSISAQTGGVSGGAHYAASKGGMLSLTKTLARDLAPFNITVNAIAPGQIDTAPDRLSRDEVEHVTRLIPLGRLGRPEEIAYAILFLASAMADYITGATLDVNGGILKR